MRQGVFRHRIWCLPYQKMQVFSLTRSLFQRRLGLASLQVDMPERRLSEARKSETFPRKKLKSFCSLSTSSFRRIAGCNRRHRNRRGYSGAKRQMPRTSPESNELTYASTAAAGHGLARHRPTGRRKPPEPAVHAAGPGTAGRHPGAGAGAAAGTRRGRRGRLLR
ncbi:PH domain-containing protein, partial [Rhodothermus marinus]|uniref:PH domain-containing protein n=1 Tax=Rhodothermus marinus TaxID=29549 RepID=UPI001FB1BBE5